MDITLRIMHGSTKTRLLRLRSEETIIGRRQGCEVRIPSALVSRQHCRLSYQDGCLLAEDLGSSNGTYLNGEKIQDIQLLRPGDRLRVGPVTFEIKYNLSEEAEARYLGMDPAESAEILEELEPLQLDDDLELLEPVPEEEEDRLEPSADLESVTDADNASEPAVDLDEEWQLPDGEDLREWFTELDE